MWRLIFFGILCSCVLYLSSVSMSVFPEDISYFCSWLSNNTVLFFELLKSGAFLVSLQNNYAAEIELANGLLWKSVTLGIAIIFCYIMLSMAYRLLSFFQSFVLFFVKVTFVIVCYNLWISPWLIPQISKQFDTVPESNVWLNKWV